MYLPNNKDESLWTINELGKFLKVKESVIRYWVKTNVIPHIRIGKYTRFDQKDIMGWIKRQKPVSKLEEINRDLRKII